MIPPFQSLHLLPPACFQISLPLSPLVKVPGSLLTFLFLTPYRNSVNFMHKICLLIIIIQIHIFISSYLNFLHFSHDRNLSQLSSKHDQWFLFAWRIKFKFFCLGFKVLKLPFQPISRWYFLYASAASFSSWAPWSSSFSLGLAHGEPDWRVVGEWMVRTFLLPAPSPQGL